MSEGNEMVVVEDTSPATLNSFEMVDPEDAAAFMDNYQEVCDAMLKETDYQNIGGKKAKKKSAWRKLATAFRISDEIVNEQLVFDDVDGQIISARYKVRATLPNGRSTIGVGVCSIYDKIRYNATSKYPADTETPSHFELRGRFSNAEHDVPSTAHTRAKNRAIADLIGAGEVSAEELEEEAKPVSRKQRNGDESPSDEPVEEKPKKTRARRGRRVKKVEEPEVIEAKAEVVEVPAPEPEPSATDDKFKEMAKINPAIKKALTRIEDADEEVTKTALFDELFNLFDLGIIDLEEHDEAKAILYG